MKYFKHFICFLFWFPVLTVRFICGALLFQIMAIVGFFVAIYQTKKWACENKEFEIFEDGKKALHNLYRFIIFGDDLE